ncbi:MULTISPECIES: hypothetical protein [unclassified Bradyrhizobium]|uniref:hypothetical protein n=1 Tax=unclassified Bradyrhizobium TaxID=2631580 RepID=UPI0028F1638D|nr:MULTISPECIES: hypothetical protein [unclassified Bradyrhizobium]
MLEVDVCMRAVAKFQFVAPLSEAATGNKVIQVIEDWTKQKFEKKGDGTTIIRRSGLAALFERRDERLDNIAQTTFFMLEPVPDGQLQIQARILTNPHQIRFQCSLALGSDAGLQSPQVDIRSPRFVREIIDLNLGWRLGDEGERIFSKCFNVGEKEIDELESLMTSPLRRLPLILISDLQGEPLAGDIHQRIAADICGLAHTCRLDRKASWELTARLGKEWSCYNGAVRLFWPFRMNRDDFRTHPLWTYDHIMRHAESEVIARDRFRNQLAERLIEASTFVADDPAFSNFEAEKIRTVSASSRASASESGDFKALADLYATENDDLRSALAAKTTEIQTLQQNIEALTIALRSGQSAAGDLVDEAPPTSVSDAVQVARATLGDKLAFAEKIDESIATLNPSAGPPDKVLRYLRTLGELSKALGDEGLGKSVPIWLRDQGIDCSGESETIKNSKDARKRRTFTIGGNELYCEFHAKPSDGVSPDLCVRIYFAIGDKEPRVRIGYIGRHFD